MVTFGRFRKRYLLTSFNYFTLSNTISFGNDDGNPSSRVPGVLFKGGDAAVMGDSRLQDSMRSPIPTTNSYAYWRTPGPLTTETPGALRKLFLIPRLTDIDILTSNQSNRCYLPNILIKNQ